MVLRKDAYPYEYIDSYTCFEKTCIPPKKAFYSKLFRIGIKNKNYQFAQKFCKIFSWLLLILLILTLSMVLFSIGMVLKRFANKLGCPNYNPSLKATYYSNTLTNCTTPTMTIHLVLEPCLLKKNVPARIG